MPKPLREAEIRTLHGDPATDPLRARIEELFRKSGLALDDPDTTTAIARLPTDMAIPDAVFDVASSILAYVVAVEEGAPPGLSR